MNRWRPSVRGLRAQVLDQLLAAGGLVGDHERHLERQALLLEVGRRRARPAARRRSGCARSGPAAASRSCVAGWVETMISSGRRSAMASIVARKGSGSPTSPVASMPSRRNRRQRQVDAHLRRFAHRLVVDHEARRGLALGHHQAEADVAGRRARAHGVEQLRAAERAVGDDQDLLHRAPLPAHGARRPARCPSRRRPWPAPAAARRCRAPRRGRRTRRDRRRPSARGRS